MKSIYRAILVTAVVAMASPLTHAMSESELVGICKAQTQARFAQDNERTRVKFKEIRGNGSSKIVRLEVTPRDGAKTQVRCELATRTGQVLAFTPSGKPVDAVVATSNR